MQKADQCRLQLHSIAVIVIVGDVKEASAHARVNCEQTWS